MSFFEWSSDFENGDDSIDQQHKKIILLINDLYDSRSKDNVSFILENALDELEKYTIFHFVQEEDLMVKNNFSELVKHKQLHDQFREKVLEFKNEFLFGTGNIEYFMDFLKKWLEFHIKVEDQKLKPYLKGSLPSR